MTEKLNIIHIGEMDKMSFAQKLAIREFCKVNNVSWKTILRL